MAASDKNKWCKVIGRAWSDPAFKAELLAEPAVVLRSYQLEVPDHVRVVEDPKAKIGDWHWEGAGEDRTMVVPLPPMPSNWDEAVSNSELSRAAAGASGGGWVQPGAAAGVAGAGTAHTGWALPSGGVGTGWTADGAATGAGPHDSKTWDGAARTGTSKTKHSVPSVPSIPSIPSDDDGGGGDDGSDSSDSSDASDASDACTCSTCV